MPTDSYNIGRAEITLKASDGSVLSFNVSESQIIREQDFMEHMSSMSGVRVADGPPILLSDSMEFRGHVVGELEVTKKAQATVADEVPTTNKDMIRIIRFCKRLQGDKNA